jgi:hypothetical protein
MPTQQPVDWDWSVKGPLDDYLENLKEEQQAEERARQRQEAAQAILDEQSQLRKDKHARDRERLYQSKLSKFQPSKYSGNNRSGMVAMKALSAQIRSEMQKRKKYEQQLEEELKALQALPYPSEIDIGNVSEKLAKQQREKPCTIVGLFRQLDTDGNKTLDRVEWLDGLKRLGVALTKEEIELTFSLFDSDGDGNMSYNEFAKIMNNDSIKVEPATPSMKRFATRRASSLALRRNSMCRRLHDHSKIQRHVRIKQQKQNVVLPSIPGVAPAKNSRRSVAPPCSVLPPGPRGPRNRLSRYRIKAIEQHTRRQPNDYYKKIKHGEPEDTTGKVLLAAPRRPTL